eukprot:scaffold44423_cov48-Cyclotella_meneghiniana.AAC.3
MRRNLTIIADGLAQNKSVQCVQIKFSHNDFRRMSKKTVKYFLYSLRKVLLNALEQFHFGEKCKGSLSFSVIRGVPLLKSLNICNTKLDNLDWKALVSYVASSMSLEKLSFSSSAKIENNQTLQNFANCLATKSKSTLKVLDISSNQFTTAAWHKLFDSMQLNTLEEISVVFDSRNIPMVIVLSNFIASNQQVRVLKIHDSDNGPFISEGWHEMMTVLGIHTSIEEIKIATSSAMPEVIVSDFAGILHTNYNMKRMCLDIVGAAKLQLIADAIASSTCSLEELEVHFDGNVDWGQRIRSIFLNWSDDDSEDDYVARDREQLTHILVHPLHRNSSIKVLKFYNKDYNLDDPDSSFKFDWPSFTTLLCNETSINATYDSNHVLQSIQLNSSDFNNEIPINLYSLVHANQNTDKLAVARQKILQNYSLENIEFVASSLPKVMSCVGNMDSQLNLSQLYGILCRVPHLVNRNR